VIPILIVLLLAVALLGWAISNAGCKHARHHGVANYYDDDHACYVHLKECDDCGLSFITRER
jgi:hypothetical protein